jgi:hypothetical protein
MVTPHVTEISALSAHHREVALVRWSLVAVPETARSSDRRDPRDPLRQIQPSPRNTHTFDATW